MIGRLVWKSALTKLPRLYEICNCVLFGTFRVLNIKSFLTWKSWTFSISKLNFFGPCFRSSEAFMKITDDVSRNEKKNIAKMVCYTINWKSCETYAYLLVLFFQHINALAYLHLQMMTTKMISHMIVVHWMIHQNRLYSTAVCNKRTKQLMRFMKKNLSKLTFK